MLDTWEGGWDSGKPTMENSPIVVDRGSGIVDLQKILDLRRT